MPDPTQETWLPVPGYEGIYDVSDLGRVRSLDRVLADGRRWRSRILKPTADSGGHVHVSLWSGGFENIRNVHRLVLAAFIGPAPDGMVTRHLDGNPANNALANLRYGTPAENSRDMLSHGQHNNARRTHCPRGHEYTPENTYRTHRVHGWRGCRECRRLRRNKQEETP